MTVLRQRALTPRVSEVGNGERNSGAPVGAFLRSRMPARSAPSRRANRFFRANRAKFPDPAAQAAPLPDPFHELETKYLFGFTEGADIGAEGEQSVEFETTAAFQSAAGGTARSNRKSNTRACPRSSSAMNSAPT